MVLRVVKDVPQAEVVRLDGQLVRLSRGTGARQLAMGELLEAMHSRAGHHELGFPSISAYAHERVSRSGRWEQEARTVARRLSTLPTARWALEGGEITWSMAQTLAQQLAASNALREDEERWVDEAKRTTVRDMRERLRRARAAEADAREAADAPADSENADGDSEGECSPATGARDAEGDETTTDGEGPGCDDVEEDEYRTISITMPRSQAWMMESVRMLMERMDGPVKREEWLDYALMEAELTLMEAGIEIERPSAEDTERAARWRRQLAEWQRQSEVLCERQMLARALEEDAAAFDDEGSGRHPFARPGPLHAAPEALVAGAAKPAGAAGPRPSADGERVSEKELRELTPLELDERIRTLADDLAERDMTLGMLWEQFLRADGWRRLGYAKQEHYLRERLGLGVTAMKTKRRLALRSLRMPAIRDAVITGRIGFEAALLISRVATPGARESSGRPASPGTAPVWIERAQVRTFKHLREEVKLTELKIQMTGARWQQPPSEDDVRTFHELEARVKSGELWRSGELMRRLGLEGGPLPEWFWRGGRMSADEGGDAEHVGEGRPGRDESEESGGRMPADGTRLPEEPAPSGQAAEPTTTDEADAMPDGTSGRMSADPTAGRTSADPTGGRTSAEPTGGRTSAEPTGGRTSAEPTGGRMSTDGSWLPEGPLDLRLVANDVGIGMVTYRFTVRAEVAEAYRAAERAYLQHRTRPESFVVFITRCMWETYAHELESTVAYSDVYDRDRWTCASPVCSRCDCTPHHVVFRSRGGGEERENLITLCVWCHLVGVHEGRIRVNGEAPWELEWVYGSTPTLRVDGRTKTELREKVGRAA